MTANQLKYLGIAVIVILAIVVVVQNTASVETKLLFVTVTMPRAVLLLVTLAAGFVAGLLTAVRVGKKPPAKK